MAPKQILKDYYFPVTMKNFSEPVYITINDSLHNGIPNNALVLKVSAGTSDEFNVCCCIHSPSGWKLYEPPGTLHVAKKLRRARSHVPPSNESPEIIFEIMTRVYSPSGGTYSGYNRPCFPILFDLWKKKDGSLTHKAHSEVLVSAVTKIPKQPLTIELEPLDEPPQVDVFRYQKLVTDDEEHDLMESNFSAEAEAEAEDVERVISTDPVLYSDPAEVPFSDDGWEEDHFSSSPQHQIGAFMPLQIDGRDNLYDKVLLDKVKTEPLFY